MLAWLKRKCLDGMANQAFERIESEGTRNAMASSFMSIAMTYPCYPDTSFSDSGSNEVRGMMIKMHQSGTLPVDGTEARRICNAWLNQYQLTIDSAFESIWNMTWDSFFARMTTVTAIDAVRSNL